MPRYLVLAEVEAENSEEAATAFLQTVEQYSGGLSSQRPFSIIASRQGISLLLERLKIEAESSGALV
jgi:hypothetical protein